MCALPLCAAALRALPPPTLPRLVEAGVPSCVGSQEPQRSEQPELRGQAAAQAVVVKEPARGALERDHGGTVTRAEGSKGDARASPTRRHPPCALPPPVLPRLGGGGCRAAVAHRYVSAVSRPSCEGKLPLRSLF